LGSNDKVDGLISPLPEHFRTFPYATEEQVFHHPWRTYLDMMHLLQEDTRDLWIQQCTVHLPYHGQSIPFAPVAEIALILLRSPPSESEIEQVFSDLRCRFGDHARHTRDDLIEARLIIMMSNLDVKPDFVQGLSQMERDALEAPDGQ
jgi:hypothetical protein